MTIDAMPFDELIRRVRSGDELAAAELVRQYEPNIRRSARNRLRSMQLRRVLDSLDVCQSVLASLFQRTAQGQYELETPEQLQRLLVRMVQNKVVDAWRRYSVRIMGIDGLDLQQTPESAHSPDDEVCLRELAAEVRSRLSGEERQILELRDRGYEWKEIADEMAAAPDAVRRKLSRAIDRVADEMGLRT